MIRHWKAIAAGSAIAVAAVLATLLAVRQSGSVSADQTGAPEKESFFSRIASPLRPETILVPVGTRIHVRLEDSISTDKNASGDHFAASLDGPLMADGKVLAPSRSKVVGELTNVKESGRVQGRARLSMVLQKIVVDGKEYSLETLPLTLVARSTVKKDAEVIGGGAAAGALIGAIAGGGKGAAIGAGVGGASGTGYVLATKGAPVAYGPESRFAFSLSHPLELPIYRK